MQKIQNQTSSNNQQRPSLGRQILAVSAGVATGYAISNVTPFLWMPYEDTFNKNSRLTQQEQEILLIEADRMVEESGISKKGFKGIQVVDISKELGDLFEQKDFKQIEKIPKLKFVYPEKESVETFLSKASKELENIRSNGSLKKRALNWALKTFAPIKILGDALMGSFPNYRALLGQSAQIGIYHPVFEKIHAGKLFSLLHEVGHAINAKKSIISKLPSKISILSTLVLTPMVIINAMFSRKPRKVKKENNNRNNIKKLADFTHKNIGLTIAGLSTPVLLEEAIASHRAIKFANKSKLMPESMKKQHAKGLKIAFASYLIGTVVAATTAKAVVSVKDKVLEHKSKKARSKSK